MYKYINAREEMRKMNVKEREREQKRIKKGGRITNNLKKKSTLVKN